MRYTQTHLSKDGSPQGSPLGSLSGGRPLRGANNTDVPSVSMLCSRSAVDGDSVAITSVAASSSRKQLRSAWQRREAKKGGEKGRQRREAKKGGEEEKQRRRRWEREMEDEIDFMISSMK